MEVPGKKTHKGPSDDAVVGVIIRYQITTYVCRLAKIDWVRVSCQGHLVPDVLAFK